MDKDEIIRLGFKPKKHSNEKMVNCPMVERTSYEYDEYDCTFGSSCEDCYIRKNDLIKIRDVYLDEKYASYEAMAKAMYEESLRNE